MIPFFSRINLTKKISKMASQYDIKEWQKVMLDYITSQLQEHIDFFGIAKDQTSDKKPNIRFLDYACGTGNVSKVSF